MNSCLIKDMNIKYVIQKNIKIIYIYQFSIFLSYANTYICLRLKYLCIISNNVLVHTYLCTYVNDTKNLIKYESR